MFSLWRCFCLQTTKKSPWISQVAAFKDKSIPSWALYEQFKPQITIRHQHNSSLVQQVRHEEFRTQSGIFVKPGDTIELENGSFLRVKEVLHDEIDNRYSIVGWRFVRNSETSGLPRNDLNEVYWSIHLAKNDERPAEEQAMVTVEDSQILRKVDVTMVNKTYPGHQKGSTALSCRWKHVITTKTRKVNRPLDAFEIPAATIEEASFQPLRAEECDEGHNSRISDDTLRQSWLGLEKRGSAAYIKAEEPTPLESAFGALSLDHNSRNERGPPAYTFADICCGAGGTSRGAEMAGLQLRWALDNDAAACKTYQLNFPGVRLYHQDIQDVARMSREDLRVDILHLSPPCQPYSAVNTTPNLKKDTANIAANMHVGNCLDKARPRIAILEQTDGLVTNSYAGGKNSKHWSDMIEHFTSRGYSVAWKIINLAELGLPQSRKRVIMIASCPGEPLPHFPKPTHARDPGKTNLKPFTSVKDAIGNIPPQCPDHEIPPNFPIPREPYDENGLLSHIVKTRPYDNYHPSGLRNLSRRELACLQGFPLKHRFDPTARAVETMKQIGNAYPSTMAAVLFGCVKDQLLVRDGFKPG